MAQKDEQRDVGQLRKAYRQWTWRWIKIQPRVFVISVLLIAVIIGLTLSNLSAADQFFASLLRQLTASGGLFFLVTVNLLLVFCILVAFSRFGDIRLGGEEARPEFSRWGWFSMLFSAGMGIGLVFYSVAEPIMHFTDPPYTSTVPESAEAASQAMTFTYYHWGFHAWGIYALMGLALAFFSYNRGQPLTLRSVFRPLLGRRIEGWLGDGIDIIAVMATLFGLATSLGLGARQVNAGLAYLIEGIPMGTGVQVMLIIAITGLATISVVLGLDGGIRRLSEFNMVLAGSLLLGLLILGPTVFLLKSLLQNAGNYIGSLIQMSTWTELYQQGRNGSPTEWQQDWTIFYWAWWISWSPFVGMFIARVSRGRTIREFLLAVLLVPVVMTGIWLSVFGNAALHEELFGAGGIVHAVREDVSVALFQLLEHFPFTVLTSVIAVVVIVIFFVTSSDSASLVIDIITAGGHPDPPVPQRIFWAVMEGAVAAVLLVGGGLKALQAAAITTGLPFALVLLFMAYSLFLGLDKHWKEFYHSPLIRTHDTT